MDERDKLMARAKTDVKVAKTDARKAASWDRVRAEITAQGF